MTATMPSNMRPLIHQEPAGAKPAGAGPGPQAHPHSTAPAKAAPRKLTPRQIAVYLCIIAVCGAGAVYLFMNGVSEPPPAPPEVVQKADAITEALRKAEAPPPAPTGVPQVPIPEGTAPPKSLRGGRPPGQ